MIRMVDTKSKTLTRPSTTGEPTSRYPAQPMAGGHVKTRELPPKERYTPKPDAAFPSVSRLIIGAVHFSVLIGIVALLVAYAMAAMQSNKRMAVATVVAPQIEWVVARADGVFRAVQPISPGGSVKKGQVIGVLESLEVARQLRVAQCRQRDLQRELLLATQAGQSSSSESNQQEIRRLRLEFDGVRSEVAELEELQQSLVIRSPIDGQIPFGLSGSKEVKLNEEVTKIWPTGSELRIEVRAPIKYIDRSLGEGVIQCRFATPEGEVLVTARPISDSRQMLLTENEEDSADKQIFGSIVCIPDAESAQQLQPGWIGTL